MYMYNVYNTHNYCCTHINYVLFPFNLTIHSPIPSPTHPSIHPVIHSSIQLFIHLFIYYSIHPSIHPYIYLSIHLPINPFTFTSIHSYIHPFIWSSFYSLIYLFLHPSIHLSIYILYIHHSCYQGIMQHSHIIWIPEWTKTSLTNATKWFLAESPLSTYLPIDHKTALSTIITAIHSHVLTENGCMLQAGICQLSTPNILKCDSVVSNSNSDDTSRHMEGLTSFDYLLEKIRDVAGLAGDKTSGFCLPYVGPLSLKHFMECLCQLFRDKNITMKQQRANLRYI